MGLKGYKHTESAKKKISEASKNRSLETRKKLSLSHIGIKHTQEAKLKIKENWNVRPREVLIEKECENPKCKKLFKTPIKKLEQGRGKFCSISCFVKMPKNNHKSKTIPCKNCGKLIKVWPYEEKIGWGKYCSRNCSNKAKGGEKSHLW